MVAECRGKSRMIDWKLQKGWMTGQVRVELIGSLKKTGNGLRGQTCVEESRGERENDA